MDWTLIREYLPALFSGLWITVQVAVWGFAIAAVFGLPVALARLSPSRILRLPASSWITVTRGLPLFVVLFWIYNGLAIKGVVTLSEFWSGAWALGLTGSGAMAEVYRGALASVEEGQREGATAIGLSRLQAFRCIVFPQAFRTILPSAVNVFVGLLKGATLVSVLGIRDMFYEARIVSLERFAPFELYTAAGAILVVTTLAVAAGAYVLERRFSRGYR